MWNHLGLKTEKVVLVLKVFLSWSGETSYQVAQVFRTWLPLVIQSVEPYLSAEDIDKGARWTTDIAGELKASTFGILFVTKDNLTSPWLNFEAGALSREFEKSRVSPFLFGVKRSEIQGPLVQFQYTVYEKEDIRKLIISINSACGSGGLDEGRLKRMYEMCWSDLDQGLKSLEVSAAKNEQSEKARPEQRKRETTSILEEMLELLRGQQKLLNSPTELFPPEYMGYVLDRYAERLSDGRGLDRTHPAYRDLLDAISEARERIASLERDEKSMIPVEIVRDMITCIQEPAMYILERVRGIRRPTLRLNRVDEMPVAASTSKNG